jgi:hypothetical protein
MDDRTRDALDFIPAWGDTRADRAAELAAAQGAVLTAVLLGLLGAKVVDGDALRNFLGELVKDLKPAERRGAYGHSLINLLAALGSAPERPTDQRGLRQ